MKYLDKFKYYIFIILFNLFIFIGLFFLMEYSIYRVYHNIESKYYFNFNNNIKFKYAIKCPDNYYYLKDFFKENSVERGNEESYGRSPDGLEFKNRAPIVIFGCSFAYGHYLNYNQTFSYKLAHLLNRTVYNRAFFDEGFEFMYYQVVDKINSPFFFSDVPPSDEVIYIYLPDHFRRSFLFVLDICNTWRRLHYSYKNKTFYLDNYNNKFFNLLKSFYITKLLNHLYVEKYLLSDKNIDKVTDIILQYFIYTRKILQEHWKKDIRFTVIFYTVGDDKYAMIFKKKLEENNFTVIETNELTDENLVSKEYLDIDNGHPTEKAWDLLTPLIIKKLDLK